MQLTFLGTRSSEPSLAETHSLHSALLVKTGAERVMIDCGSDWESSLEQLAPSAIILTHAHPDHTGGLSSPYPCPVYASQSCWQSLEEKGLATDQVLDNRELSLFSGGLRIQAFDAEHSLRAPMTGLKIEGDGHSFIYLPDVARLADPRRLLFGAKLYIGDGTTFGNELMRREGEQICGHASIINQLTWAARAGVQQVLFTHCGSTIHAEEERALRMLKGLAARLGLHAAFAHDGMEWRFDQRP